MSLFKSSAWSLSIVATGAIVGFFSQKLYAVYTGAQGLLAIGNFNNFASIVYVAASGGIYSGIVKLVAATPDPLEQRKLLSKLYGLLLLFAVLTSAILFFADNLLQAFLYKGITVSEKVNLVFYLSLPAIVFSNGVLYVLNGLRLIKRYALLSIGINLLNLLMTWVLVTNASINGALLSLFLPSTVGCLLMFVFARRQIALPTINFNIAAELKLVRTLLGFSVISILAIVLLSSSQLWLRDYMLKSYSIAEGGDWQALSNLSKIWMAVITGVLSMHFFPLVSSITGFDKRAVEVKRIFVWGLPTIILAFGLVYLLRNPLIELVYSTAFLGASKFFHYQLIGDIFKTAGMVFAYLFLAGNHFRFYICSEILFTAALVILSVFLGDRFGMEGVFMGYLVSHVVYLFLQLFFFSLIKRR